MFAKDRMAALPGPLRVLSQQRGSSIPSHAKLLAAIVPTMRSLTQNHLTQLLQGAAPRNLPNLKNLAMELRKICCHPVSGWVLV